MNNNRQPVNNNNRRRGRNNNTNGGRPQNNNNRSGFDYQNQIDNKARGNASQMLEKYKKLASDAQLNGDRVTAESYLQFADHYFRVLADFRSRQEARQDDNRRPQRDDMPREDNNRDDNASDDNNREEGRDDWRSDGPRDLPYGEQAQGGNDANDNNDNQDREERPERQARPPREERPREERPRQERRPREDRPADRNASRTPRRQHSKETADAPANEQTGIDLAVLPPSIAISSSGADDDGKPVRKPRARRVKAVNDDSVVAAAE